MLLGLVVGEPAFAVVLSSAPGPMSVIALANNLGEVRRALLDVVTMSLTREGALGVAEDLQGETSKATTEALE